MRTLYVCHDLEYWHAHRAGLARIMAQEGDRIALLCGVSPQVWTRSGGRGPWADDPAAPGAGAFSVAAPAGPGNLTDGQLAALGLPAGSEVAVFPLARHQLQPVRDARLGWRVLVAARHFRPDVVHLLTLKPALFGGAALRLAGPRGLRVVATFPGLGRVFAPGDPDLQQRLVTVGLRRALGGPRTVATFENADDRARLVATGVVPMARSAVLRGAGFDPAEFAAAPMPPGPAEGAPLRCLFASRLLRAKGALAVLDAARILAAAGAPVRIALAGPAGGDPDAIPEELLAQMAAEGVIEHLGQVPMAAMPGLLARHHLLLLPTRYPEGTPRILAEAGSVGRPAISSDHPGCTAFLRDGREGIVLANPDGPQLARAILRLAEQPQLLSQLGAAARRRALEGGFALADVAAQFRRLYAGQGGDQPGGPGEA